MRIRVTINDSNRIIGEGHHRSKISDRLVNQLRTLNENWGLGWRTLARQFELPEGTVKKILSYERRNGVVRGWRTVEVADPQPPAPPQSNVFG